MMKRFACVAMAIILVFLSIPSVLAVPSKAASPSSIEEILNEYHSRCAEVHNTNASTYSINQQANTIKQETIAALNSAGYYAYDLNPSTYQNLENELQTDFDALGLDTNHSYIIVLSGDDGSNTSASSTPYSSAGSSFSYTYNGTTHTMRYLTVTASDNSSYGKASSVSVLNSKSTTVIQNCLNATVSAILDNIASSIPFGTIASICGLQLVQFNPAQNSTMTLNAGTNWTRCFTQIYNSNSGVWLSWSSVAYVTSFTYMSGLYYSSETNSYVAVPSNKKQVTRYSDHYSDYEWRKSQAAIGWQNSSARHEYTGNVTYYYSGNAVITHTESI